MKQSLFVIGNGFDLWQGLPTRYSDFETYYESNKTHILQRLGIEPYPVTGEDGFCESINDFELLYEWLNEFGGMDPEFWNDFEQSLSQLDDVTINLHFGKEKEGLRDMVRCMERTIAILRESFSSWVRSIDIQGVETRFQFPHSLFLNFNYTETLQRRFRVDERAILYVHGRASLPNSVCFGHDECHEPPSSLLQQFGGRFSGLHTVMTLLYMTDKQVAQRIKAIRSQMRQLNLTLNDFDHIYILGHSLGKADRKYFRFLANGASASAVWHFSCHSEKDRRRVMDFIKTCSIARYRLHDGIDGALDELKAN